MNGIGRDVRGLGAVLTAIVALAFVAETAEAQRKKKQPDPSQAAVVTQTIGANETVTITYHRPGVKGRDIWNETSDNPQIGPLVPKNGDPRPWRAGANEATKIEFSADVKVEGKDLKAGEYALFMIPTDGDWTIIFSTRVRQWGSFNYRADDDALRVTVTPTEAAHAEWLTYGFDEPLAYGATAYLHWEKVKVPFKIELAEQE